MAKGGSVKVIILPTAKIDLKEIVNYIAKDSPKYARLEKLLIIKAIEQLYINPDLGVPFNYKSINARSIIFRNYFIIYRYKTELLLESLPSATTRALSVTTPLSKMMNKVIFAW